MHCPSKLLFAPSKGKLRHPSLRGWWSFANTASRQSINRPQSDPVSPNLQARHDGWQRLRAILDSFLKKWLTSTTGCEAGGILHTDPMYDSSCQAAHSLADDLQSHIRQASGMIYSEEAISTWKIQHAFYWYSMVSLLLKKYLGIN
jgi:hypothetical protein